MNIRLNKAHYPVTALGPGRRIGFWMQGCSIGCSGCLSRDTWDANSGIPTSIDDAMAWARKVAVDGPDGVTISGGEPFEQPEALLALLKALGRWRAELPRPFDLLAYSGIPLKTLRRRFTNILARLDAVIAEPYVASLAPGAPGMGSSNQSVTCLTPLGTAVHAGEGPAERTIQVSIEGDTIWYIGVPLPGDLAKLEDAVRRRGLEWRSASWRA